MLILSGLGLRNGEAETLWGCGCLAWGGCSVDCRFGYMGELYELTHYRNLRCCWTYGNRIHSRMTSMYIYLTFTLSANRSTDSHADVAYDTWMLIPERKQKQGTIWGCLLLMAFLGTTNSLYLWGCISFWQSPLMWKNTPAAVSWGSVCSMAVRPFMDVMRNASKI